MSDKAARGVVIHAPRDLRIESVAAIAPGPRDVRVAIEPAASAAPICIISIMAASAPFA
jgi:hypothetical protein